MSLLKSSKYRKCKFGCDIWLGDYYRPQRRGNAICHDCIKKKKPSIMGRLLTWLGKHGT